MRLWHESLIPYLPRQQLLGQHRECCALRGNGWGRKHSTVNYVFKHAPERLFLYHDAIMKEMEQRGYNVDPLWKDTYYRGKKCDSFTHAAFISGNTDLTNSSTIYPEHDGAYLKECIANLAEKGITIDLKKIK